jgi:signal transduction histidine kinase
MQGFVGFRIPLWVRRLVTMIPSIVVVALGADSTQALIFSQVVLSSVLPVPMISLVSLTRRRDVMGSYANGRFTSAAAMVATSVVLGFNVLLLLDTFGPSGAASAWVIDSISAAGAFALPKLLAAAVAIAALCIAGGALLVGWSGMRWIPALADVTRRFEEHERLLSELRQAKEVAERAEANKSRALAAAGHDLKQPLQLIVMCLDAMRHRLPERADRERAAHTLRAAEGLGRALDRLLVVSQLKSGMIERCWPMSPKCSGPWPRQRDLGYASCRRARASAPTRIFFKKSCKTSSATLSNTPREVAC